MASMPCFNATSFTSNACASVTVSPSAPFFLYISIADAATISRLSTTCAAVPAPV